MLKMKKLQKGFTLIELLVVIAIIGILSSVVLASLNTARNKGNDAKVKAQMAGARASAEVYFDTNNGYGTAADCTSAMFADNASGMANYTLPANVILNYPSGTVVRCGSNGASYAITASLNNGGVAAYWCVDSTGKSKQTAGAQPANNTFPCP